MPHQKQERGATHGQEDPDQREQSARSHRTRAGCRAAGVQRPARMRGTEPRIRLVARRIHPGGRAAGAHPAPAPRAARARRARGTAHRASGLVARRGHPHQRRGSAERYRSVRHLPVTAGRRIRACGLDARAFRRDCAPVRDRRVDPEHRRHPGQQAALRRLRCAVRRSAALPVERQGEAGTGSGTHSGDAPGRALRGRTRRAGGRTGRWRGLGCALLGRALRWRAGHGGAGRQSEPPQLLLLPGPRRHAALRARPQGGRGVRAHAVHPGAAGQRAVRARVQGAAVQPAAQPLALRPVSVRPALDGGKAAPGWRQGRAPVSGRSAHCSATPAMQ